MMMDKRKRFFNSIIGAPGCGKSEKTGEIIKTYPQDVVVLKHIANIDDVSLAFLPVRTLDNWKQGRKPGQPIKCKIAITRDNYKAVMARFANEHNPELQNGLLVLDDAGIYEKNVLSKDMSFMVSMRRHIGVDIILNYYGLSQFPIEQFIFLNYLILFNTNDSFEYKGNKLPGMAVALAAAEEARKSFQQAQATGGRWKPSVIKLYGMG